MIQHVDGKSDKTESWWWKQWDVQVSVFLAVAVLVLLAYNHSSTLEVPVEGLSTGHSKANRNRVSSSLPSGKKGGQKRPEYGFTLLVSFFAATSPPDHYPELLGALRANIANPAVDEVAVLYEPLAEMGCAELAVTLSSRSIPGFDGGIR